MAKFGVPDGSQSGGGEVLPISTEQHGPGVQGGDAAFPVYQDAGSTPSILGPGRMPEQDFSDTSEWTLGSVADDDGLVDDRPGEAGFVNRAWRALTGSAGHSDEREFSEDAQAAPVYEAEVVEQPVDQTVDRAEVFDDLVGTDDEGVDDDRWSTTEAYAWAADRQASTAVDIPAYETDDAPAGSDMVRAFGLPVSAAEIPPVRPPRLVDSLRQSVATTLQRRDERQAARSAAAIELQRVQAIERQQAAEQAQQLAEAKRQQHEALMLRLAQHDAASKTAIIDGLAASRAHASPIEPADLLRLPTIAQANARVRDLVARELSEVAQLSPGALEANRRFFDPSLLERMQSSALYHEAFAEAELARTRARQPVITELTDPAARQARIEEARDQVATIVSEAQQRALPSVYINPTPETGQPHREYAFELATRVAGVPEGRFDTVEGSRSTVVFARMAVNEEGRYTFVPEMDGISPILERCGDPQRGEGVFLRNVMPGGLDGRASGVFVRRPGDTYEGGITIEARYAGKMPVEPEAVTTENGAVDLKAMRESYLSPEYDAVFEVEARHVHPDHYNQVQAGIIARDELTGRPAFVDPRMVPLFEAQATRDHALIRFDQYADTVRTAHEAGRTTVRQTLEQAGYAYGGSLTTPREIGTGQ